ncbi:NAD(P)-dependent oxidoreductase [Agromyces seonyuensis]|uniref:NAD(P)H-binding protein n=1 Tax=Agromyces seonyuensis TaxID=2662446 RepID=A0A6I4P6N9_9MICO|nr:NAD(P)-binding oxidoreductase [Agromyces seonyuensis]MWB99324.1 NAD(P)H-binding protein [Agromyces seonyuensis]
MRIVVLGATGNVGSRLTARAASAGHQVVAFARRPEAVASREGVTVVAGSAEDAVALEQAARGADAVVVSITGKMSDGSFMQKRLPGIIAATKQAGVRRLILISVFGAGDTSGRASGIGRLIYKTALSKFLRDKAAADQILQRSGLDWTIVYPVNLKAAPALPQGASVKNLGEVAKVPGLPTLPLDNAAAAVLDIVTDPGTIGQRLLITTPTGFKLAD